MIRDAGDKASRRHDLLFGCQPIDADQLSENFSKRLRLRISDNSNNRICFGCLDRECESVCRRA